MNRSSGIPTAAPKPSENDGLGVGFERTLPVLKKNDGALILVDGDLFAVKVDRRIPGPCYWVKIVGPARVGEKHILSCGNFGGLCDVD